MKFYLINKISLKVIVLLCTFAYSIFFVIIGYFTYQFYFTVAQEMIITDTYNTRLDIANLVKELPVTSFYDVNFLSIKNIQMFYEMHGINNPIDFIYPTNIEVETLHYVLKEYPDVGSKFSNITIQELLRSSYWSMVDLGHLVMKKMMKLAIPLGILIIANLGIHAAEVIQAVAVSA